MLLRALLPAASLDALAILRRRGIAFAILTIALTAVAAFTVNAKNEAALRYLLETIGSATALTILADAMRIARPDYRLDVGRVLRLMWYALLFFGLLVACYVPFAIAISVFALRGAPPIVPQPWKAIEELVVYLLYIVLGARFAFICFLCEQEGARAFSFSLKLTAPPALWPTLLLFALMAVPSAIVASTFDLLRPHLAPAVFGSSLVCANLVLIFGTSPLLYPLLMRWMMVCERLHPNAYVGFNEDAMLDANLA